MSEASKKKAAGTRLGHRISIHRMKGHPVYRWRATYVEGGVYRKKGFKTKKEAEDWQELREPERLSGGTEALLTASERSAVLDTREALEGLGLTLREALEIAIGNRQQEQKSASVGKVFQDLIATKERERKSARYISNLRSRLGRFGKAFEDRMISTVTRSEIQDWLHSLGLEPESVNSYRREIGVLFGEAVAGGYAQENPVQAIKPVKVVKEPVGILTPDEAARLIAVADPAILPAIAIGLFAGVRTEELKKLEWEAIDFHRQSIRVGAAIAKSARNRIIKMSDNLRDILSPLAKGAGSVWPTNGRKLHEKARQMAGFSSPHSGKRGSQASESLAKDWPENALRHSFASYHLAHHQNASELALALGHTDNRMIFEHYREVVTAGDAARFWRIGLPSE
jgi:integrase